MRAAASPAERSHRDARRGRSTASRGNPGPPGTRSLTPLFDLQDGPSLGSGVQSDRLARTVTFLRAIVRGPLIRSASRRVHWLRGSPARDAHGRAGLRIGEALASRPRSPRGSRARADAGRSTQHTRSRLARCRCRARFLCGVGALPNQSVDGAVFRGAYGFAAIRTNANGTATSRCEPSTSMGTGRSSRCRCPGISDAAQRAAGSSSASSGLPGTPPS